MVSESSIIECALQVGFDAAAVTNATPAAHAETQYLGCWLDQGRAGTMGYMYRNFDKRVNPRQLMRGARSVICLAVGYKCAKLHPPGGGKACGVVSDYALYDDYHETVKEMLRELATAISGREKCRTARFKLCVDSVPIAERSLAARAGLGFIGRNHALISPEFGPAVFLAEVVTDLEIEKNISRPAREGTLHQGCAGCDRCIKACPTGALGVDGSFDARKCISYLTIEHKGEIAPELSRLVGERLFGCDNCVKACPYYEKAPPAKNDRLGFNAGRKYLEIEQVLKMTQEDFTKSFAGTSIYRLGLERLKRNARVCLENINTK